MRRARILRHAAVGMLPTVMASLALVGCGDAARSTRATATPTATPPRVEFRTPRGSVSAPRFSARVVGQVWAVSLDLSPRLAADAKEFCCGNMPSDCRERLREQAAREGLSFEAANGGAERLALVTLDGDTVVSRTEFDVEEETPSSAVLVDPIGRRLEVTLEGDGDRLRVDDRERGARTYTLAGRAPPPPVPDAPLSAWREMELGPESGDGLVPFRHAPLYTAANVGDVFPGGVSAEAVVVHYLASRVRGDTRFREVVGDHCDPRCQAARQEHDGWRFEAFRLMSRHEAPNHLDVNVRVWMKVRIDGRVREITKDFVARLRGDGRWALAGIPS